MKGKFNKDTVAGANTEEWETCLAVEHPKVVTTVREHKFKLCHVTKTVSRVGRMHCNLIYRYFTILFFHNYLYNIWCFFACTDFTAITCCGEADYCVFTEGATVRGNGDGTVLRENDRPYWYPKSNRIPRGDQIRISCERFPFYFRAQIETIIFAGMLT